MSSTVFIALRSGHADTVAVTLTQYLGAAFEDFRAAMANAGARWNSTTKANLLPLAQLPELLRILRDAGFGVEVEAQLKGVLEREAGEATRLAEEGRARLAEVERRIRASGLSLFPYQKSGVQWLAPRRAALLADEPGLGKTVQALVAVPANAPVLVVAPAAVQFNWLNEAKRWRPDLTGWIAGGAREFRWPRPGEVLVTTFGSLPHTDEENEGDQQAALFGGILMPAPGTVLLADEAHLLKNSKATRVKRWRQMRDSVLACDGRVWLLTGTPLLNRPRELWSVLDAAGLATQAFGSWPHFQDMFVQTKNGWSARDEVPLALQKVSLHRRRIAVLPDLPRKLRQQLRVPIDADTARLCDEAVARMKEKGFDLMVETDLDDFGAHMADRAELANSTRRGGIPFELISQVRAALAAAKLPAAIERIESYEDQDEPLLVFCMHVDPLRAIGSRQGWATIDGTTPPEERTAIVARFQAGGMKGLALSFAAGGVGITLTRAHHVLCIDLPWTPALLQQGEDRCCRIGQDADSVHVEILEADHPLDYRVAELLLAKAVLIEAAVERSARPEDYVGPAPADALAEAAQTVVTAVAAAPAQTTNQAVPGARAAGELQINPTDVLGKFRGPRDELELHAGRSLLLLAAMDPDHASEVNGAGFSQADNDFGHSLAKSLGSYGRLSDRQWEHAVRLAQKYRRQVGDPPLIVREGAA